MDYNHKVLLQSLRKLNKEIQRIGAVCTDNRYDGTNLKSLKNLKFRKEVDSLKGPFLAVTRSMKEQSISILGELKRQQVFCFIVNFY